MLNRLMIEEVLNNLSDGVYVTDRNRVIRYWNRGAERLTGFGRGEVIGNSCKDGILTHVDCNGKCLCGSSCPLAATIGDGLPREAEVFMHHKDGHRVPVHVTATPIRDEKGEIIGVAECFHDAVAITEAKETIEMLEKIAMVDTLTGLANRRCLDLRLKQRLDERVRYGWPVAVFLADIDHFKLFNDTHGHDVGDRVLKMVGAALGASVRSADIVGRWGGEEFLGILTTCTAESMRAAGERARMLVEKSYLTIDQRQLGATISIGMAEALETDTPESLIKRADQCLYQSKTHGRNRVTIAGEASAEGAAAAVTNTATAE